MSGGCDWWLMVVGVGLVTVEYKVKGAMVSRAFSLAPQVPDAPIVDLESVSNSRFEALI